MKVLYKNRIVLILQITNKSSSANNKIKYYGSLLQIKLRTLTVI